MAKKDAAALRAARQERLAKRKKAAGEQSYETTKRDDTEVKEAQETSTASEAPAVFTAAVLDPSTVTKTASVDLLLYGQDSEDPHWVVLASGKPVAEIRLSDQEEPQKVARLFVTEQYAEGVREAAKQFDFAEVMQGVRARSYVASVANADAYRSIEARVQQEAKHELRKAKAALRDDTLNMLNLVVLAQTKNFLQDNPLKDEFHRRMTESGIDTRQAVAIIEGSYQARAAEHFEACFKQAMKWQDLQPEALSELEEQIKGLAHRAPMVAESDEMPRAASFHNIPLETRTAGTHADVSDDKEELKAVFGLRRK